MTNTQFTSIDASTMGPTELNTVIHELLQKGMTNVTIHNVNGQRFIGAGLVDKVISLKINGTPGNDLGVFMEGPTIHVVGNTQDSVGNTMSSGSIVVDGHAGDVVGYAMRGGEIIVRGDVGYRTGINMKEYQDFRPTIIVGGRARDFLGEYMAGGTIVVLGIHSRFEGSLVGEYTGTGMHAGSIFIRGDVEPHLLGKHLETTTATEDDLIPIMSVLERYAKEFDADIEDILSEKFTKITAQDARPYKSLYAPM